MGRGHHRFRVQFNFSLLFFSLFHCNSPSSLVTSGLFSLWQPAPGSWNDLHRVISSSQHQPTGHVLRHLQLAAAARSHCCLWLQHVIVRQNKRLGDDKRDNGLRTSVCVCVCVFLKGEKTTNNGYLIHRGS